MKVETLPAGPCNVRGGEVLRLGKRRAYRVVRWLGGHRLPPAGMETELRDGCIVRRWGSGYDVRGPREMLVRFAACLTAQERVERAATRSGRSLDAPSYLRPIDRAGVYTDRPTTGPTMFD